MPGSILIADDNADNILLIKRILRRSALDVEFLDAQSGREALDLACQRLPRIVLMDMKMPGMDGYEAATALKSDERTKAIPVIAITAQAMIGDREKALHAGCDEYLMKPIDPIRLVEIVKKYLKDSE